MKLFFFMFSAFFILSSCHTMAPVNVFSSGVPMEQKTMCIKLCDDLEMKLSGMVVIQSSAGCVCEIKDSNLGTSLSGGSLLSGSATIAIQRMMQQQQSQHRVVTQMP